MKIATWNVERPDGIGIKSQKITEILTALDADVLVLTETNELLDLKGYHVFHSAPLDPVFYKKGERRVSVYSKYKVIDQIAAYSDDASLCVTVLTPLGPLAVYGTIIGIYGNRRVDFNDDIDNHVNDFDRIASSANICIAGDLNISFSDNYYFTKTGRDKLNSCFSRNGLVNTTTDIPQNIDHIILPDSFVSGKELSVITWNEDKTLSDHIGIGIQIKLK